MLDSILLSNVIYFLMKINELEKESLAFVIGYNLVLLVVSILFNFSPLNFLIIIFVEGLLITSCYSLTVLFKKSYSISEIKKRLGYSPDWLSFKSKFFALLRFNIFSIAISCLFFIVTFGISLTVLSIFLGPQTIDIQFIFSSGFLFTLGILFLRIVGDITFIIFRSRNKNIQFNFDFLMSKPGIFVVYFILMVLSAMIVFPIVGFIIYLIELITPFHNWGVDFRWIMNLFFLVLIIVAKVIIELGNEQEKRYITKRNLK